MIVWINGTFGVGKTTTATIVSAQSGWRLFDPEHVGYLLAANLRDHQFEDFQDLAPWRTLVPAVAEEIFRFTASKAMLAVQTVLVEEYWAELVSGLEAVQLPVLHIVLDCDEQVLRSRIEADEAGKDARQWRIDHVNAYQEVRPWLIDAADLVIDTSHLTPDEVAGAVSDVVGRTLAASS